MSGLLGQTGARSGITGAVPAGNIIQYAYRANNVGDHRYLTSGTSWVDHGDNANLKFDFTPKRPDSTMIMEYFCDDGHSSTSGGYGALAFCKDALANRNTWGGMSAQNYNDTYGHMMIGFNGTAGLYVPYIGRIMVDSLAHIGGFELNMGVKRHNGNWYYLHVGARCILSITEVMMSGESST